MKKCTAVKHYQMLTDGRKINVTLSNLTDFHVFFQIGEKEYIIFPDLTDFPPHPSQSAVFPGITEISLLQIERQKIIKQLKQVKEERRHLERIREELTLQQYHACDSWKKKYFETKKVTASLEEILTKLREDLELYYKKLLVQLEARQVKMRPRNMANITESKVLLNVLTF